MECHVAAGIGVKASARLAGRTGGAVSTWRKSHGLKTERPRSPYWLSLEEKAKRAQEEAFVREQKAWLKAVGAACWSRHSEYTKCVGLLRYYANHEENKEKSRRNAKSLWERHKQNPLWREKRKQNRRNYWAKSPEKCRESNARWKANNPEKWKECRRKVKERQKADPVWRAMHNVRRRLRDVLHGKRSARTTVGCSKTEFMQHIESKFKRGMHWNNYGTHWHMDHIVPVSAFDLSDPYQAKMVNHWTNLQPLEAKKNIEKSNTIQGNVQSFLPI